ncbi:MAG: di-heme oxidoredictase family protein [Guyparkeria sp.]|uniref:di-heme oxidoreductase family protein n=1 Tax=Guyparkeria sp. TaxID=2035736 RepID=UPI0039787365
MGRGPGLRWLLLPSVVAFAVAGQAGERPPVTVDSATSNAFSHPLPGLSDEDVARFTRGDADFETPFVSSGNAIRPGLGPVFNASSCEACHPRDSRGAPPPHPADGRSNLADTESMFLRVSVGNDPETGPIPVPGMGTQLQQQAVDGAVPEADVTVRWRTKTGEYADGTPYELRWPEFELEDLADPEALAEAGYTVEDIQISPRVAPPIHGRGYIEAIDAETLRRWADPDDADGDGISGRVNRVLDVESGERVIGRIGLKANNPSLRQQNAGAYHQDMGVTNTVFPTESEGARVNRDGADDDPELGWDSRTGRPDPEAGERILGDVTFYTQALAVPSRRFVDNPEVRRGERLFEQAGCAACHRPKVATGEHPDGIELLSNREIAPYSDFLLHDMGEGLADGRGDFEATGREWRTPPLWGIGLNELVTGHRFYLHDGRARGLAEAILWHGGEAEPARESFRRMTAEEREALLTFLRSL